MSLLKNVSTIGGLTLVSRVLGFARDILLARVLGAGGIADAWQLAFQLPNIFRRLFAEGAFASAFVPLFNQRIGDGGDMSAAQRFANAVMAVLIPILIGFSALFLLIMPWVLLLFASDRLASDAALFGSATDMARIAFPYLGFMSLATLLAAVLNSLDRFAAAAAAPIFLNICLVVALIAGSMLPDTAAARATTGIWLAIAVSVSGVIQLGWLYVFARRAGFQLSFTRPRLTSDIRELGVLILPAVLGAGVYQISRFIDLFFIGNLPDKSITFLAMADRLNQLPLGIIGIALGTAILPALSRFIAQDDADGASRLQSNAVELAMLLTLPAAAALYVCGPALTSAFYVGGRFTADDGLATGAIVAALVVGLPAYVLVKVLVPAYFARKDTRTPVITAALSLTVNVALNFALIPSLGLFGLALAGSLGAWCNAAMLYGILHRNGHYRLSMLVLGRIARIGVATAVMTAALLFAVPHAMPLVTGALGERLLAIGGLVGLGAIIFFGLAIILGVVNRDTIGQLRRRKA